MDDSTVTEHWERLEEGYNDNKPKSDDNQGQPKTGNDQAKPKHDKQPRGPPKRPASATFQSALHQRARKNAAKPKGSESTKKTK